MKAAQVIGAKRGRARQASSAKGAIDDIPVARRSIPQQSGRPRSLPRMVTGAAAALLVLGAGILIFPQPLRLLLGPPPVSGLNARAGLDGRLLGHFSYGEVSADQLVAVAPGIELQRNAAAALATMGAAARADGVNLVVLSGYRSIALQKHLFFDVKSERNQTARERARVSAPPGYSEHATGFAIDIGDGKAPGTNLFQSFDQTRAYAWLRAHAASYQFTLSFPRNNAQGVNNEPWHWRYEGNTEALRLFEPAQRLGY